MAVDGKKIKKLRKEAGLTQEALGMQLGVIKQTVSNWENNISEPNSEILSKIASIFNIPIGYLYGDDAKGELQDQSQTEYEKYSFFFFDDLLKDVFTSRLKRAISDMGIGEKEFLDRITFNRDVGEKYLSGEREPSLEDLIEISQMLGTSIDYLLGQIPQLSSSEKKLLNAFSKLDTDYQDIVIGKAKEYLMEQDCKSVAADEQIQKAK